jgi:hypothetical protein
MDEFVSEHRWSGWPGAWCLDCGAGDQTERCAATHSDGLVCECGVVMCELSGSGHRLRGCDLHRNQPCPSPGAKLFDPYNRPR